MVEVGAMGINATMRSDETDDAYHASQGISASGLKLFHQSPIRFWATYIQPDPEAEEDVEEKEHFLIGKAGHCYVNEPHRFADSFVEMPSGIDKRTTVGKKFWAEFQEEHKGASVLKAKSMRIVRNCAEAMLAHPTGKLIRAGKGIAECSIRWVDPDTGIERKARPDFFMPPCDQFPYGLIVDLKFVSDASPEGFEKEADKFGYFIQAPWYQDALMQFYGTEHPAPFVFLCAEKSYPWIVQQYDATPELLDFGRSIIARRLPEFAKCLSSGIWPAYSNGKTLPLKPNKWSYSKEKYLEY